MPLPVMSSRTFLTANSPPPRTYPLGSGPKVAHALSTSTEHADVEFVKAAMEGNLQEVQRLLPTVQDVNVHVQPRVGNNIGKSKATTALHGAAAAGHLEVVRYLLEQGAEVNTMHGLYRGLTALHEACSLAIAQLLLDAGASLFTSDPREPDVAWYHRQRGRPQIASLIGFRRAKFKTETGQTLTTLASTWQPLQSEGPSRAARQLAMVPLTARELGAAMTLWRAKGVEMRRALGLPRLAFNDLLPACPAPRSPSPTSSLSALPSPTSPPPQTQGSQSVQNSPRRPVQSAGPRGSTASGGARQPHCSNMFCTQCEGRRTRCNEVVDCDTEEEAERRKDLECSICWGEMLDDEPILILPCNGHSPSVRALRNGRAPVPTMPDGITPVPGLKLATGIPHAFHTACIQGWFQKSQVCPTCRQDVRKGLKGYLDASMPSSTKRNQAPPAPSVVANTPRLLVDLRNGRNLGPEKPVYRSVPLHLTHRNTGPQIISSTTYVPYERPNRILRVNSGRGVLVRGGSAGHQDPVLTSYANSYTGHHRSYNSLYSSTNSLN